MTNLQVARGYFLLTFLLAILFGMENAQVEDIASGYGADPKYPRVTISQGTLQGFTVTSRKGRKISSFLGIPYAKPPIGKLRFSNPVPADCWIGVLNATKDGPTCPQLGPEGVGTSEDCLYLNVHTPQIPEGDGYYYPLLPVMVFFPGGGFETHQGHSVPYAPTYLGDAGGLLVTVTYRLGPLGFMCTGDEVVPGNAGLKDQVQALKWVQENIARFGGDPKRVTIFGESAGGASVQFLALSNSTIGLFDKMISESGGTLGTWSYRDRSFYANISRQLGEMLGCPTNSSYQLIECLRECNASDIINTRLRFFEWLNYPLVVWGPTNEVKHKGAFLTEDPLKILEDGNFRDVESMTGTNSRDGTEFVPDIFPDSIRYQEFLTRFDELVPIVFQHSPRIGNETSFTAAVKEFYFDNDLTTNQTRVWNKCEELFSDAMFHYPAWHALQKQVAYSKKDSYLYSFDYRGTWSLGDRFQNPLLKDHVMHADELIYLYPVVELWLRIDPATLSGSDLKMIDQMTELWTSYAIDGKPKTTPGVSNTTWLPYGSQGYYLSIGNGPDPRLELKQNYLRERMEFWNNLTYNRP